MLNNYPLGQRRVLTSPGLPVVAAEESASHPPMAHPCPPQGSGMPPVNSWDLSRIRSKVWGMTLIPLIRFGAPSQKVNLLGEVAQTLIYSRPFRSLIETIFLRIMLNNPSTHKPYLICPMKPKHPSIILCVYWIAVDPPLLLMHTHIILNTSCILGF